MTRSLPQPRVLIFATTYVETANRLRLTHQWLDLHRHLNPHCDILIVDSNSPVAGLVTDRHADVTLFSFPDNIGHLLRNGPDGPSSKGRDGWGRAFCHGLNHAIAHGYDYVVHIEGDSLFRLPVLPIVHDMRSRDIKVASVPVVGTRINADGWVETGLMFFDVGYLKAIDFAARYDWPNRTQRPTPEAVVFEMLGQALVMMPWRAERGNRRQITLANVTELDWVTHCDGQPEIYDRFVSAALEASPPAVQPLSPQV